MMIAVFLLVLAINNGFGQSPDPEGWGGAQYVNRLNYGVIFRKHALFDNAEQYWYHTFKIHLPSFHDIDNLSDICSGTISHIFLVTVPN